MKTKEEIWKTTASLTGLSTKTGRKLARLILICFTAKEISADDLDNRKHERDIKEKKTLEICDLRPDTVFWPIYIYFSIFL